MDAQTRIKLSNILEQVRALSAQQILSLQRQQALERAVIQLIEALVEAPGE